MVNEINNVTNQLNNPDKLLGDIFDKETQKFLDNLKTGVSPTSNLTPSDAFLDKVISGIGLKSSASTIATAATSGIAAAVTSSVAVSSVTAASSTAVTATTIVTTSITTTKIVVGAIIAMTIAAGAYLGVFSNNTNEQIVNNKINEEKTKSAKQILIEREVNFLKNRNETSKTSPVLNFNSPSENVD